VHGAWGVRVALLVACHTAIGVCLTPPPRNEREAANSRGCNPLRDDSPRVRVGPPLHWRGRLLTRPPDPGSFESAGCGPPAATRKHNEAASNTHGGTLVAAVSNTRGTHPAMTESHWDSMPASQWWAAWAKASATLRFCDAMGRRWLAGIDITTPAHRKGAPLSCRDICAHNELGRLSTSPIRVA